MSKICTFAGHSKIYNTDEIYYSLLKIIEKLIVEENVEEFWVGNYGEFDSISAKALRCLKEKYPHIELNLIVPYLTADINKEKDRYYKNYDCIIIADIPPKTPKRLQILKCNEYMVKNADFLVCCVVHSWGGAAKTLGYAQEKKDIKIFNISQP